MEKQQAKRIKIETDEPSSSDSDSDESSDNIVGYGGLKIGEEGFVLPKSVFQKLKNPTNPLQFRRRFDKFQRFLELKEGIYDKWGLIFDINRTDLFTIAFDEVIIRNETNCVHKAFIIYLQNLDHKKCSQIIFIKLGDSLHEGGTKLMSSLEIAKHLKKLFSHLKHRNLLSTVVAVCCKLNECNLEALQIARFKCKNSKFEMPPVIMDFELIRNKMFQLRCTNNEISFKLALSIAHDKNINPLIAEYFRNVITIMLNQKWKEFNLNIVTTDKFDKFVRFAKDNIPSLQTNYNTILLGYLVVLDCLAIY